MHHTPTRPNVLQVTATSASLAARRRQQAELLLHPWKDSVAWEAVAPRVEASLEQESVLCAPLVRAALVQEDALLLLCALVNAGSFARVRTQGPQAFVFREGQAWAPDGHALMEDDSQSAFHIAARGVDATIEAGRTIHGLVLDRSSPLAKGVFSQKRGFVPLDDGNLDLLAAKLEHALQRIAHLDPALHAAFHEHVQTLVPSETDPATRTRVVRHGASSPLFPGVIFMNDYHRPEISSAELAENLVHEFCHTYLFALEEFGPWYADELDEELRELTVDSPWSTRTLPYYSFFHSLVVFATVGAWTEAALGAHWDSASAGFLSQRLGTLRQGFAKVEAAQAQYFLDQPARFSELGRALLDKIVFPWLSTSAA